MTMKRHAPNDDTREHHDPGGSHLDLEPRPTGAELRLVDLGQQTQCRYDVNAVPVAEDRCHRGFPRLRVRHSHRWWLESLSLNPPSDRSGVGLAGPGSVERVVSHERGCSPPSGKERLRPWALLRGRTP